MIIETKVIKMSSSKVSLLALAPGIVNTTNVYSTCICLPLPDSQTSGRAGLLLGLQDPFQREERLYSASGTLSGAEIAANSGHSSVQENQTLGNWELFCLKLVTSFPHWILFRESCLWGNWFDSRLKK